MPHARVLAPLALTLALAGCTGGPAATHPPAPSSVAGAGDAGAVLPTAEASPTWDDHAAAAADVAADTAVAAYLDKSDPAGWFARLTPHLTAAAVDAYSYTDPSLVPGTRLLTATGPGQAVAIGGSGYLAAVPVRTDAGIITARLVRTGAGAPWLVDHFDLPPGTGR